MSAPAVAITGLGCISAAGRTPEALLEALRTGRRNLSVDHAIPADHPDNYPTFALDAADAPDGFHAAREPLRCGMLAIDAARSAIRQAGLTPGDPHLAGAGVCIGTTVGNAMNNESFYREFVSGARPGVESIVEYFHSNPAEMVAETFALGPLRQTVANACSSGTVAIGEAAGWIRAGLCDIAVAGGADILCRTVYNGFILLKITDRGPCRPFDARRAGLNLGEGAGAVVLESPASARRRGARILGLLRGYGNASDAYHASAPDPEGGGLARAITAAMTEAGIEAAELAFINAHGTGTPENDRMEGRLFPRLLGGVPYMSTKGVTGHMLGAAGAVEAVITLSCLNAGWIAPCVGFEQPDEQMDSTPVAVPGHTDKRFAMSDSAAFGGNNGALVFEKGGDS